MLQLQNITKAYPTGPVLEDVTFRVDTGERVGLIGPNGAGKTTIVRIICGELEPDKGEIIFRRNATAAHVRQQVQPAAASQTLLDYAQAAVPRLLKIEAELADTEAKLGEQPDSKRLLRRLGALQTEFEQLGGYAIRTRAQTVLSGLGFHESDMNRPLKDFSGGWRMRAELTRALVTTADLLLLDEPTNYLDIPAIEWLKGYLKNTAATYILVSHDRFLLNELTNVTIEVTNCTAERYPGNYSFYVKARQQRREQLEAAKKSQDRKIDQIEKFAARFGAKNTKASAVKSRLKQLDRMERVEVPTYEYQGVKIRFPKPPHCGHSIMQLTDGGKSYNGTDWVLKGLNMQIERGDKMAIVGANGMGKTTLLRVLAGRLDLDAGERKLGHEVRVGYQAQDFPETMDPLLTVWDTARRTPSGLTDGEVRGMLGAFRFSGDDIDKTVGVLSGGEKVRLALCKLLLTAPNFLLLDEPTTHLDIPTREFLQDGLSTYDGTVCLVSHDIEFIRNTAHTVLDLSETGAEKFHGDYDYYHEKMAQRAAKSANDRSSNAAEEPAASGGDRKVQKREAAEQRNELYKRRKPLQDKIDNFEKKLDTLHTEQEELCMHLADPDLAQPQIIEYNKRLAVIKAEIDQISKKWLTVADALEEIEAKFGD
jgi:ATP-binding cassette subfamily F protein 3